MGSTKRITLVCSEPCFWSLRGLEDIRLMQTRSCDNYHADQLSQRVALAEESIPPIGLLSKEFQLHYPWLLYSIRMVAKKYGRPWVENDDAAPHLSGATKTGP